MDFPNLDLLESAAEKLRPLLPEIVFVGGCATGLLIKKRFEPGADKRLYSVFIVPITAGCHSDDAGMSAASRSLDMSLSDTR